MLPLGPCILALPAFSLKGTQFVIANRGEPLPFVSIMCAEHPLRGWYVAVQHLLGLANVSVCDARGS